MGKSITIKDEDIVEFYEKNPHLNIVDVNRTFIDILKTLSTDLTKTMENSKLGKLDTAISSLREELHGIKKEYSDEVGKIVNTKSLEDIEKISSVVERNTSTLVDKTKSILDDVIPKNHIESQKHIELIIREFHDNISADTKRILESSEKDDEELKKITDSLEDKFNGLSIQLQQPIFNVLSASEERINKKLDGLNDSSISQSLKNDKLTEELLDFLNKFKNNSHMKGAVSENMLYSILQRVFPCDDIEDCRGMTASGDFMVRRMDSNCPTILFENKDYNKTINTDEVSKFERDVKLKKCHGIFLSQFSPITFKRSFQIDIIDGLIHVYVPNTEFSVEKVQIAADIVDSLSVKLEILKKQTQNENMATIPNKELVAIADEYREYASKRENMIEFIKSTNREMLERMDGLHLPRLRDTLTSNGIIETDVKANLVCQFCKNYTAKSRQSVAAHSRKCKLNPKSPLYEQPQEPVIDNLELV